MNSFFQHVLAKYIIVSDFKTVEKKFLDQGEDKAEIKKYLDLFKKLREKNKLSTEEKNIDLWAKKDFKDFKKRLDELDKEKTNTEKRKGAINTAKEVSGAKKIKEDDNWVIYEILTNDAAAELGQGTEWCIKHNPSEHWEFYSDNNIYYLISRNLPSKDPWAKIAFLIDKEGETSYWDALDEEHSSVPKELKIPNFKYEKPEIWRYSGRNLYVSNLGLTSLDGAPNKVDGHFICTDNKLIALKGSPKIVGGDFDCSKNNLKSLVASPKIVLGKFSCSDNKIQSLVGAPKHLDDDFNCSGNKLTSLEGAPEKVGGSFDCSWNHLTSLEGAPKEVRGDFNCRAQKSGKKFTEKEVRAVCNVKGNVYV